MIPLCTTATKASHEACGWAFARVTPPWVAHRVWEIPVRPFIPDARYLLSRSSILPTSFLTSSLPSLTVATPAESYPLYSTRLSPSNSLGEISSSEIPALIPHHALRSGSLAETAYIG